MSKILVFSGPYDDHHKTFTVTSKSISYVEYIFNMNDVCGDEYIFEYDDEFLDDVEALLNKKVSTLDDIKEYFLFLIKDSYISLEKFSNILINIIPTRRGSWASYTWVKTGEK